jgi:hypothetical protein
VRLRKAIKVVVISVVAVLSLFVLIIISFVGIFLFLGGCATRESTPLFSPDNRYSVQTSEQNCGATTPFNTYVTVKKSDERKVQEVLFIHRKLEDVELKWLDNNNLQISYTDTRCPKLHPDWDKYDVSLGPNSWNDLKFIYIDKCPR